MNKEKEISIRVVDEDGNGIPKAQIVLYQIKNDTKIFANDMYLDIYGCPLSVIKCDKDGNTDRLFLPVENKTQRIIKFAYHPELDDPTQEIADKKNQIILGLRGYWFLRIVRYENEVLGIVEIEVSQTELPVVFPTPLGYNIVSSEVWGGEFYD